MRTEETVIVNTEYIYDDEEQARMLEIQKKVYELLDRDKIGEAKVLLTELENILNGEWERPLPF